MKRTTRKKLVFPLIAVGLMTTMMWWDSLHRPHAPVAKAAAAARMAPIR